MLSKTILSARKKWKLRSSGINNSPVVDEALVLAGREFCWTFPLWFGLGCIFIFEFNMVLMFFGPWWSVCTATPLTVWKMKGDLVSSIASGDEKVQEPLDNDEVPRSDETSGIRLGVWNDTLESVTAEICKNQYLHTIMIVQNVYRPVQKHFSQIWNMFQYNIPRTQDMQDDRWLSSWVGLITNCFIYYHTGGNHFVEGVRILASDTFPN